MKQLAWKWSGMVLLFFIFSSASSFVPAEAPLHHLSFLTAFTPTQGHQQAIKKLSHIKRWTQGIRQTLSKRNAGLIILVILGTLLATVLLAFVAFILAYGGLPGIAVALIGIIGLVFIIWGAVKLIKNITRRRSTTHTRYGTGNKTAFTK